MRGRELTVPDSFLFTPTRLTDHRGCFYESYREDALTDVVGHRFTVAQTNFSVSSRGVLRGLHGVALPPGQAKVVTCHRGAVLDVVVDIRTGSPTFGTHAANVLTAESGAFVYVAEGLGHAFLALTDDTCVGYLCSTRYVPGTQVDLNPLDPDLGLDWGMAGTPLLSEKDATAPTLAVAAGAGLLATYADCLAHYQGLRGEC
ncbi:dTDP-4-dehydrorhamnose 3,5-epimerase family protein [Actinophytocola sp.]|uniref:dTDP-4-dehydrorhamnose 3,5-epimerase family protein n=1 Tax=Actinophytocola sp. TaxID=1872138 RepID=UPI0038998F10